MKQGTGRSTRSEQKVEGVAHRVSVPAVSRIGVHQVTTSAPPLETGRMGLAPRATNTVHRGGSQGKH